MSEVENIIRQIITTSPAGDDKTIIKDIKLLLNNADSDKLITKVLRDQYTSELTKTHGDVKLIKLDGDAKFSIVSKYNVKGLKFVDYNHQILFDYDFINNKIIDVEEVQDTDLDDSIIKLQKQLNDYIIGHYNMTSYGMVIPCDDDDENELKVVIIGEKLNDSNYYNGKWISVYELSKSGELSSTIRIKIHYYEDGNVAMNSINTKELGTVTKDNIVNKISEFDSDYEIEILKKVNQLNESKFKKLRRLMPISRSRIQWGRAIGNYKLGQDVVGGRH